MRCLQAYVIFCYVYRPRTVPGGRRECSDSECESSEEESVQVKLGELKLFLQWYVSSGQEPNIAQLAHAGLPAGRGRKGGVPKRKHRSTPTVSPDVFPATSQNQPGSSLLSVLCPTIQAHNSQVTQSITPAITLHQPVLLQGQQVYVAAPVSTVGNMLPSATPTSPSTPNTNPQWRSQSAANARAQHGHKPRTQAPPSFQRLAVRKCRRN